MTRTWFRDHLFSFYAAYLSFERFTIFASQVLTDSQITDPFNQERSCESANS
jgi:hypothetical protein